ncbi:MAG TPA: glycosyltransferase family 4 protein [Candidatus Acidoferrales bacterium]|jgi:glycosyltransferase involved in cell wall biosynthesis|nr:glycosyltransferase family 4 protein [Candidatus Acidoferrales bacterium]
MRVTHVITRLVVGGAQENTLATIGGLRQKPGLDIKLISGPTTGPEGSLEPAATAIPGSLTIVPELVRPVHPLKDFFALRKLEQLLRDQKPDIVHTHSGKAGILGRLAAKRAGVPIIVHHIHGPSFGNFQGPVANWVFTAAEKRAAKVTDHFFCSAGAMSKLYLAAGIGRPEMYTRIFSGFGLEPFLDATNDLALRQQLGLDAGHFVIGKIGRIFRLKGHADLVTAFAKILPEAPHARLLFVGDGSLRGEIVNQILSLGLTGKVIFTGLVPPGDVARHVGIMDCLAHLSYREALSRALPQALAAGKPVVAYDFDGADEICLENETGFLVRTGDTGTAAKRLLQLAHNPALREKFGRYGKSFVRENFSIEKMVDDQYHVYLKLAAERGLRA